MDPNATVRRIASAAQDGDWAEAAEAANDLDRWVESGGFQPDLHLVAETIPDTTVTVPNVQAPDYTDGWF